MLSAVFQFGAASVVVVGAGIFLTRSADRISEKTGLGRALVGSLLLAGATSLPEFTVIVHSVRLNTPNLGVGDLLGASLLNLLILAILDLVLFRSRSVFSNEFRDQAASAVLTITLAALVGVGILSRFPTSILNVGLFSWILLGAYLFGMRLIHSRKEKDASQPSGDKKGLLRSLLIFGTSTLAILLAAPHLVEAAKTIAEVSGLGETFIGTTLLGISTALPEMVATIAAFRIGAPELALANIFGSNAFNMTLLFPLDLLLEEPLFKAVSQAHGLTALCLIVVTSLAVLSQLTPSRKKRRIELPASAFIILAVLGFLYLLYSSEASAAGDLGFVLFIGNSG